MTLDELRTKHKADILRIAGQYGVTNIRVFGSVVRGDARPDSDVDILVNLTKPLGFQFFEFEDRLKTMMHCDIDLVTERSLHPYLKDRILGEAVPL